MTQSLMLLEKDEGGKVKTSNSCGSVCSFDGWTLEERLWTVLVASDFLFLVSQRTWSLFNRSENAIDEKDH